MIKEIPIFLKSFVGGAKVIPTGYISVKEPFSHVTIDLKKFEDEDYTIYYSIKGVNAGIKIPLSRKKFEMLMINACMIKNHVSIIEKKFNNSREKFIKAIVLFIPNIIYLYYLSFAGSAVFQATIPTNFSSIKLRMEARVYKDNSILYFVKIYPYIFAKSTFSYQNILELIQALQKVEKYLDAGEK